MADIFGGLLRAEGLRTPGYREIYFSFAPTALEAVSESSVELTWHRFATCVLPADRLAMLRSDPASAGAILVPALREALARLIRVDHLNPDVVERALTRLAVEGRDAAVMLAQASSKNRSARVVYRVGSSPLRFRFRLEVLGADGAMVGGAELGEMDMEHRRHLLRRVAVSVFGGSRVCPPWHAR